MVHAVGDTVAGWLSTARQTYALAALDAELLLAHTVGKGRTWLYAHADEVIEPDIAAQFTALMSRRANDEPIAYLLGRREFFSLELEVDSTTLVPRPETELLVERALALFPGEGKVADLGTGSGAIAIAIKKHNRRLSVVATDNSQRALMVAARNAQRHVDGDIDFREGDWCNALADGVFDLIVTNPPYLMASDTALENSTLRYEPTAALASGSEGLDAITTIIEAAGRHLHPQGHLLLEHGHTQAPAVRAHLRRRGFVAVTTHRDLAGHERMTEGQQKTLRGHDRREAARL